ncbi:RtcB family protein [Candidatus Woesearchaeota archaeon]|nr:RtcB family protein [Candidatus Woesearchaeota archaeon]MBT3537140.1 RtcB family protein [Candidatus Woesearchaeota archaeon]MBT4697733.1 RtcB family protein [Candidatus Woesearchaeota archaeon]MBT4716563.1 RtcB family protein [Candidatus Woesearchaeota archaeon]MBT7106550.1 RtcB family protein [Candidatus Woesearchaeota archaeon]
MEEIKLNEVEPYVWEINKEGDMLVPGRVYGDKDIIQHLLDDVKQGKEWNALKQIKNVACLPGIQKASLAMSDVHPGYGFCIGGVGAFDVNEGVISVAGVGFDVNCGVRTMSTPFTKDEILKVQEQLADSLYNTVPAGVGSTGDIRLDKDEIDEVLLRGAKFSMERGYGTKGDLDFIEENGFISGADPEAVSDVAKRRQFKQIGTLGAGNHYLEVQYVDKVYDEAAAKAYGLSEGQVLVSIHCGSRALGHQIGTDYLKTLEAASKKYNIPIRERELVCAPFSSEEGQKYFSAVNAGINCAFANRQAIAHLARKAFTSVLGGSGDDIKTFYEIGHNNAKLEKHDVNGELKKLIVHRKGSTRAFGPGRDEVPEQYRAVGQPVLVGGTMGTHSFILHGTEKGMRDTFGSAIHGAGRAMSRKGALSCCRGNDVLRELRDKGILVRGHSIKGIAEEAPKAYKPVEEVVDVMHNTGIAKKVVSVLPLISIKG